MMMMSDQTLLKALDRLSRGDTSLRALQRDIGPMMVEGLLSKGYAEVGLLGGVQHVLLALPGIKCLFDLEGRTYG